MTSDPITVSVDTNLTKVRSILREENFRSIPVLSKNRLEGLITRGDMMFLSSTKSNLEARVIMEHPKVLAVPEMEIEEISRNLLKADTVQAPVVESTENMKLVGTLSIGDILKKFLYNGAKPKYSNVSTLITKNVVTANHDDHISKVWSRMDETGFSGLPVLKKKKMIGMITRKDIIRSGLVRSGLDNIDKSIKVEKIMKTPTIVITAETDISKAAMLMVEHGIGRLPVVEHPVYVKKEPCRARESELVGIISREDILRSYLH